MNVKKLRRIASARERADHLTKVSRGGPTPSGDFRIHHADFRAIDRLIAPGSVDLALCDPPWGGEFGPLRKPFAEAIYRILQPDGIFACYTGVAHLPEFLDAFRDAGLKYEWTLVGRRQVSSVRQRNLLINRWVPIVLCRKGRFKTALPMNDVIESTDHDKSMHTWQQPVEEAATLVRALSRPGALVCDLVVGSGSTAVATVVAGERRRFVGCEADSGLAKAARARVAEAAKAAKGGRGVKLARG